MNPDSYYRDHWVEIDATRLDNYEAMFEWHPRMEPLLAGARLEPGQHVVDFGCGPGGMAMELARRVAPGGSVHGIDLNADMIARARARAEREGLSAIARFSQADGDRLPLDARSVDRVLSKSVLEYVEDPARCIDEFRRVVKPGGLVHVIDSDWGMLVAEPLAQSTVDELFEAARMAYRTPHVGRRLYGLFRAAGLRDVEVKVLCAADTKGIRAPVLHHMIGYARDSGRMDGARLDAIAADLARAVEDGTYLFLLPQFVVTGAVA